MSLEFPWSSIAGVFTMYCACVIILPSSDSRNWMFGQDLHPFMHQILLHITKVGVCDFIVVMVSLHDSILLSWIILRKLAHFLLNSYMFSFMGCFFTLLNIWWFPCKSILQLLTTIQEINRNESNANVTVTCFPVLQGTERNEEADAAAEKVTVTSHCKNCKHLPISCEDQTFNCKKVIKNEWDNTWLRNESS